MSKKFYIQPDSQMVAVQSPMVMFSESNPWNDQGPIEADDDVTQY